MPDSTDTTRFRFWLWLIRFIGLIVPRRLRADWRQEWEVESPNREALRYEMNWRGKKADNMRSACQDCGVKRLEPNVGIACAQGAARPFTFKLAQDALSFRDGQAPPFDFGHQQAPGVFRRCFRIGRDQVQLDIAFPIAPG